MHPQVAPAHSSAVTGRTLSRVRPLAPSPVVVRCAIVLGLLAAATPAHADRAFTPRYSANETGDITMAANTLLTCPASDARCGPAQRGASASNNSFRMGVVDIDGDAGTFNPR